MIFSVRISLCDKVHYFYTCTNLITPALGKAIQPTSLSRLMFYGAITNVFACVAATRYCKWNFYSLPSLQLKSRLGCQGVPGILHGLVGAFEKIAKKRPVSSSCLSVCPFLRLQQLCSYWKEIS